MDQPTTILVDARALHVSGLGRYLREILAGLFEDARFGRITLLGDAKALQDFVSEHGPVDRVRIVPFPLTIYSPRFQTAWTRLAGWRGIDADAVFFPHYDAPLISFPRRSVVTVHDLIHFQLPAEFTAWRRAAAGVLLRNTVRCATRVVTVSESTRRDLVERFPDARTKVEVVPNGVGPAFSGSSSGDTIVPSEPYLLCVGNRKPHKNLVTAVRVLAALRDQFPELKLVVVGRSFPEWSRVLEIAAALEVRERVIEFENLTDAQLAALYAGCRALLFPSLYEGFGLPALEAMAAGAPVIATDRSSVPEVVGDAAILCDPLNVAAISAAARSLMSNGELRETLSHRGRERAALYTWTRAAQRTADVIHAVGSSREHRLGRRSSLPRGNS